MKKITVTSPKASYKRYKKDIDMIAKKSILSFFKETEDTVTFIATNRKYVPMIMPATDTHFPRDTDRYQYHVYSYALKYVSNFDTALDIGGHVGFYARAMCENFSKVISVEANLQNMKCLTVNVPKADKYLMAIGDENKEVGMTVIDGNSGENYIDTEGTGISMITVDDLLKEISTLNLIKIDVQGFEQKVITGAQKTIEKFKPVLLVEVEWNRVKNDSLIQQIIDLGYKEEMYLGKDCVFLPI